MSRPLRVQYSNAFYHVMNRGAGRKKIFFNNTHRIIFLELLQECHQLFSVVIHAYCLMDNHYHLLVSTPNANLSRVMRHLNGVYTQRINRIMKTDGALFRGRYKAKIIEEDCYLLVVSRYIHLNPIEAGLVTDLPDYKWSSYPAYLKATKAQKWLTTDVILNYFSTSSSLAHINDYQNYVEKYDFDEINLFVATKLSYPIIGSEIFKENILSKIDLPAARESAADIKRTSAIPSVNLIMKHVCLHYHVDLNALRYATRGILNWPRLVYMYICRKYFGHSLRTIGHPLGSVSRSTVSTTILNCHRRLRRDSLNYNEIKQIYDAIKADEDNLY